MAQRTAVALKLGIGSERLASYETGRAPLPWIVGERFCELLFVGQTWLATGTDSPDNCCLLRLDPPPPPVVKFSEAHDNYFMPQLREARAALMNDSSAKSSIPLKLRLAIQRVIRDENLRASPAQWARIMAASSGVLKMLEDLQREAQKSASR